MKLFLLDSFQWTGGVMQLSEAMVHSTTNMESRDGSFRRSPTCVFFPKGPFLTNIIPNDFLLPPYLSWATNKSWCAFFAMDLINYSSSWPKPYGTYVTAVCMVLHVQPTLSKWQEGFRVLYEKQSQNRTWKKYLVLAFTLMSLTLYPCTGRSSVFPWGAGKSGPSRWVSHVPSQMRETGRGVRVRVYKQRVFVLKTWRKSKK